jgi:hypothetical protein
MIQRTAVVLCAIALASAAQAETLGSPGFARELRGSLGLSSNPLGLQQNLDLSWSRPLSASGSALRRDAHLSFGLSGRLTPAYARAGAWAELAPLSVLEVRAGVEPVGHFGTFHSLLPYSGYDDAFSDEARRARDGAQAGIAARAYVAPAVKARAGRLLIRGRAELERWTAHAPGPFFYEPSRDTLLKSSGDTLAATETVVLWSFRDDGSRRLLAGPIHELTVVPNAPENRRQDVGLVAVCGLGERRFGLPGPVVFAKLVRYLEDPNRQGGLGAQLAVAFAVGKPR